MLKTQATNLFPSPAARGVVGESGSTRLFYTRTSSDFNQKELPEEDSHGGYRAIYNIGGRIPLLTFNSVKSRRAFTREECIDGENNAELAQLFKSSSAPSTGKAPNVNYGGATSYGSQFQRPSVEQLRKARPPAKVPDQPSIGVTGGRLLVEKSWAQQTHDDKNGQLSCVAAKAWKPRSNLAVIERELEFWETNHERFYRRPAMQRPSTQEERRKELGTLLDDLRRKNLMRGGSAPATSAALARSF